ncbi:MAG: hypothetical protein MRY78_10385 [Saprospiraceae bacterium]|nr:hypothetical protein [Saprospiraceae bacterium]
MWHFHPKTALGTTTALTYHCHENGQAVSIDYFWSTLQTDATLMQAFRACLQSIPFPAYFWETPPATLALLSQNMEFTVLPSSYLAQAQPNFSAFAEHFESDDDALAKVFPNLGGDALLVVPRKGPQDYPHLSTFVQTSSDKAFSFFWRLAANTFLAAIPEGPRWLSTSGLGVPWLHLRIDQRPKYYHYRPYKVLNL